MEQQLMMLKYSSDYSEATGSSWFYSEDEADNFNANTVSNNDFKYNTKLTANTVADRANESIY